MSILPSCVSSFASGQINEVDFADGFVGQAVHEAGLDERDGEYGMAPTENEN